MKDKLNVDSFNFNSWPYQWFGIFASGDNPVDGIPTVDRFIDRHWMPDDFAQLINYLHASPTVLTSSSMPTPCMICGRTVGDPGSFKSDGIWLWPQRLTHYVEEHHVRLPDVFVTHIQQGGYRPPDAFEGDVAALPWPAP